MPLEEPLTEQTTNAAAPDSADQSEEKQCRICLDGEDPELGRLIRPCLCKGSVSVSIEAPW